MSPPAGQLAGFPPGAEMDKPAPGFFLSVRQHSCLRSHLSQRKEPSTQGFSLFGLFR